MQQAHREGFEDQTEGTVVEVRAQQGSGGIQQRIEKEPWVLRVTVVEIAPHPILSVTKPSGDQSYLYLAGNRRHVYFLLYWE